MENIGDRAGGVKIGGLHESSTVANMLQSTETLPGLPEAEAFVNS